MFGWCIVTIVGARLVARITSLSLNDTEPLREDKSFMKLLLSMGGKPSMRSILKSTDFSSFKHEVVDFLLVEFNGDCIFELPPLASIKEGGVCRLDGMDCRFNGHVWTETATTTFQIQVES